MITVEKLGKIVNTHDGQLEILKNIDFTIENGTSVAITGESGSGKSTLLSLLAGLDRSTSGKVIIDQQELGAMDEDQLAKFRANKVGFIFQSFHLLGSLTALENVMLPIELKGIKDAKAEAQRLLDQVGLNHRLSHYPKQLSGGEQQRVAIARAFATKPAILFADEPTGNLDSKTGNNVAELLFELNASHGTTLVLVTHDEKLAQTCANQIVLSAGMQVTE